MLVSAVAEVDHSGVVFGGEDIGHGSAVVAVIDANAQIDVVARREAGIGGRFVDKPNDSLSFVVGGELTIAAFSGKTGVGGTIESIDIGIDDITCTGRFRTIVLVNELVGVTVGGVRLESAKPSFEGHGNAVVVRAVVALDV